MSTFRTNQNNANSNKLNTVLSAIVVLLLLNVSLQIWLLYTALNYALQNNMKVLHVSAVGSVLIFLISMGLLYYLPRGKRK